MIHPYRWKKLSVGGALAYRWDGRKCRFFFRTIEKSFGAKEIVTFLRLLRRLFRGRKVILLWDRLPGHKAALTQAYLATQKRWLTAHWLPAYAPELNPTEFVWGHAKGGGLANQRPEDLDDVADVLRGELRKITPDLGFAFLQHAGLSLD